MAWSAALFAYGVVRSRLGVDLTDEGAYLAWPMRVYLGDPAFSADLLTLVRPVEDVLALLFRLWPDLTLMQFRLLGWGLHLGAAMVLARLLFRLSGATVLSLLAATLSLFAAHLYGILSPSYNTLSSDSLLLALSLWALAGLGGSRRPWLGAAAGFFLFVAVLSHPGLALVAAPLVLHELARGRLLRNVRERIVTPSNAAVWMFLAACSAFVAWFILSGAYGRWQLRLAFSRSALTFGESLPVFLGRLLAYPFTYDRLGTTLGVGLLLGMVVVVAIARFPESRRREFAGIAFAICLSGSLLLQLLLSGTFVVPAYAAMALVAAVTIWSLPSGVEQVRASGIKLLASASMLAAVVYATLTFSFGSYRSWVSGVQGLPFAFGTGLVLLAGRATGHWAKVLHGALLIVLGWAGADLADRHFQGIYRDGPVENLTTEFSVPRLRGIRSSPERVQVLDALYRELRPRLPAGAGLLVYDSCPLLYFLFEARPAYGMAWAVQYGQRVDTLEMLNAEFLAKPLPEFAVRCLVDIANSNWATAPRLKYENYPLNSTVESHYELERTIYPFEIWRLKRSP